MNGAETFGKHKDSIMLKVTAASLQQYVQAYTLFSVCPEGNVAAWSKQCMILNTNIASD